VNFKTPLEQGDVIHVTFAEEAGLFDFDNKLELYSARSRFPLQYTYRVQSTGEPIQDDLNAFLYTADRSDSLQPSCAQKGFNASYHPIMLVECSAGDDFGNPYDMHTEELIHGTNVYSQKLRMPREFHASFIAMFLRGAGLAGDIGLPGDHLYLSVVRTQKSRDAIPVFVYGPTPIIRFSDRLFKSRSHWYGHWFPEPLQLLDGSDCEYSFELSSPGSAMSSSTDGYVFTYSSSTLLNSPNYVFGRAEYNGDSLGQSADAAIILREYENQTSVAVVDEIMGSILGPIASTAFPITARERDNVRLGVLTRNIAAVPTRIGGEIFSRILDYDTGATVSAAALHLPIGANNEDLLQHTFIMPAADIHLLVQVGHVEPPGAGLGGTLVVDDEATLEVRLIL
jgi:hypothetical protein